MSNSSAPNFQADNPRRLKAFEATSSSLDFIQNTHSPFLLEMANKIGSLLFLNKKDLSILDFPKLENLLIKNSRKVADEYEFSSKAPRNLTMIKLSPCEKFLTIVSPTHIFVISLADFLLDERPQTYANFEISNPQNEYKSIEWPCRTDIYIENPYFLSLDSKGNLSIHILNSGQTYHIEEDTFLCGTFSLDGKYILAINSKQELAIIDVFTLKITRKKTIQNSDNDIKAAPSYLTQIDQGVILIGSLVKSASNPDHHGVPTIDLLHCDLDTESPIIVYRIVQMPYPSTYVEFCTPTFKTIHLTESNLLFLGHSEADYLYAIDLENGASGPQRLDLGGHMARGFSVLKLRLVHEEGRPLSDQNDPIAHLPNLPRVLALDSSGELHQFRFSTSRLLPGDSSLPSEPLKLEKFRALEVQPTVYIKHLFNEPSMFTIVNDEEEEEENILSRRNNVRSPSPEQFISPERKNKSEKPEIPSFNNNEQAREDQATLWRRQQFETPSFEGSPINLGLSKGNNILSGFKNGHTETQKLTPSVTDLKSREPSMIETTISKEREERVKEFEKRIIRKKDIFQGNPTEGYQNHIKCLSEDAKEVIEASKKIKADIAQRNLDSLQRIIRTLNKGNSYCETALDEAQETFNQKNTETSSQSQSAPKEEQKLKNLIESYQQRLSLMSKNLTPLDLFVDNNQMILSVAPTTEVRRIECSSSTQKLTFSNNSFLIFNRKSTSTAEKNKPSQSLGRKGLVSSFQMSLKEKKQYETKKESTSQSQSQSQTQPLFDDEHEEMMEQKNQRVYERQERIIKTLNLLNYLLNQKTTVIDNLQQSLENIRKDSGSDKKSKHNRGIYYHDSSDEENKVPLVSRKQKFQTAPANPFEITLQQPNKFTGSQHRDQFLKDLLTHLSTRNSKHEMVLLKSYSTSMAKTDPSLYKFVDHLHLDEECAASKKAINQGLSDILTKAREKKREDERIAEQKRKEEEERRRKAEEEERKRKEAEEKKRQEEAARKKAEEEAARKKAAEEEAKKKAAEEAARRKAAEEEAKKKAAEQATAAANTDATVGGAPPAQGGQTNEHIEKYMKNNLEMSSTEIDALQKMKNKFAGIMEQMKQGNINPAAAIFILTIQNLHPAWDTDKFKALLTNSQKKFDAVKVAATSDNKKYAHIKVTGFDEAKKYILLDGQSMEGHTLDVQIKLSEKTVPGGPAPTQGQGQQQQQAQVNPTPQKTAMGGIGGMGMGGMGGGMGGLNLGGNKGMQQQQQGGGNMFQTGGQTQSTQAAGGVSFGQSGGMGMGGMGTGNKPTGVAFGQTGGMGGGMGGGTGGATFGKPAFGSVGGGQAGGLGGRPAFGQTGGMMGQGQSQGQGMKTGGGFGAGAGTGTTGGGGFMGFQGAVQQNKPAGGVSFGTSGGGTGTFGGSSAMFGAARK